MRSIRNTALVVSVHMLLLIDLRGAAAESPHGLSTGAWSAIRRQVSAAEYQVTLADQAPGNNSATDADTVGLEADLFVTKDDGVTSVDPGGSLTYTIVAGNAGPSDDLATLIDFFPVELTCSYTSVASGGAGNNTVAGVGDLSELIWLPTGSSVTYTVDCTVDPGATGTLSNTVTITASVVMTDPNLSNNIDTDTDCISGSSRLRVGAVSGTVRGGGGRRGDLGLPGVEIQLFDDPYAEPVATTLTDACGDYSISLPDGTYTARVDAGAAPGHDHQVYDSQCSRHPTSGTPIIVNSDELMGETNFALPPLGTTKFCDGFETGDLRMWSSIRSP